MQIVTIGGSGFLGLHVAQILAGSGHHNRVLTRDASGLGAFRLLPGVTTANADVYDSATLEAQLRDADAVVSMAGILNESGSDGKGFHRVHVELVERIIEACQASGVRRVLHVSALGAGRGESHYQVSKGEAEARLAASGLDVTVFRPSVIFGRGDSFFNRFAGLLKLAPVLPLACPDSKLQPVWARDVACAMRIALDEARGIGEHWELGGPQVYSLKELVAWTAHTLGLSRAIVGLPSGLSRLQASVMDFVPGKPFSTDNFRSLQVDNVTQDNAFPRLGITPASIDAVVPGYLVESPRQARLDESRRRKLRGA
jgi:NADH dehydrogenase